MEVYNTQFNMTMLQQHVEVVKTLPGLYCRTHFHG